MRENVQIPAARVPTSDDMLSTFLFTVEHTVDLFTRFGPSDLVLLKAQVHVSLNSIASINLSLTMQEMLSFQQPCSGNEGPRRREAQVNAAICCLSTAEEPSPSISQFGSSPSFCQVDGGRTFSRAESAPFANEGVSRTQIASI